MVAWTLSRPLGRFRRNGWIHVTGRTLTVRDRKALEGLIEVSGGDA